jgi:hypothetical protein
MRTSECDALSRMVRDQNQMISDLMVSNTTMRHALQDIIITPSKAKERAEKGLNDAYNR